VILDVCNLHTVTSISDGRYGKLSTLIRLDTGNDNVEFDFFGSASTPYYISSMNRADATGKPVRVPFSRALSKSVTVTNHDTVNSNDNIGVYQSGSTEGMAG
jgi:hypothetical protein